MRSTTGAFVLSIACVLLGQCSSAAAAAPPGVTAWEPARHSAVRPRYFAIRDNGVLPPRQDVIFGPSRLITVVDLPGLLASFGVEPARITITGDFEIDRERSGYRRWVVLQQWATLPSGGRARVVNGRIALHADPAGMVDFLEWGGIVDPVLVPHEMPINTQAQNLVAGEFRAALARQGRELLGVVGLEPLYLRDGKSGLVAMWQGHVYSQRAATGERAIERMLLRPDPGGRWTLRDRRTVAVHGTPVTTGPSLGVAADWDSLWSEYSAQQVNPTSTAACTAHRLDREVFDHARIAPTRREGGAAVGHLGIDLAYNALGEIADALYTLYDWCEDQPVLAEINSGETVSRYLPPDTIKLASGDGVVESSNAEDRDIVYHESIHRVVNRTTRFGQLTQAVIPEDGGTGVDGRSDFEALALNESVADIFAAVMDAYNHSGQPRAETWKVFEDSYLAGDAYRYLDRPGDNVYGGLDHFDPQLSTPGEACTAHIVDGVNENATCGIHGAGGLSSLSFYLTAQGGFHPRLPASQAGRIAVEGVGWFDASRTFFDLLDTRLGAEDAVWTDLRAHLGELAAQRYGAHSPQVIALCKAFDVMGLAGTGELRCSVVPEAPTGVTVQSECGEHDIAWDAVPGATQYAAYSLTTAGDYANAFEFHRGANNQARYSSPGRGAAARRFIYVRACNAYTCGPFSSDYDAAEPMPATPDTPNMEVSCQ